MPGAREKCVFDEPVRKLLRTSVTKLLHTSATISAPISAPGGGGGGGAGEYRLGGDTNWEEEKKE